MQAGKLLARPAAWVCHSAYLAKLSMLLVPEAYMVQPTMFFALAASAPAVLFPWEDARGRRIRLKGWQVCPPPPLPPCLPSIP